MRSFKNDRHLHPDKIEVIVIWMIRHLEFMALILLIFRAPFSIITFQIKSRQVCSNYHCNTFLISLVMKEVSFTKKEAFCTFH